MERGRVKVEQGAKRIRVMLGGEVIADTTKPLLVWEIPYYPTYYFPEGDVRMDLIAATGETKRSPSRGEAELLTVKAGSGEGLGYRYLEPKIPEVANHIAFDWGSMDHWFEEDEEAFVHARDPYTRLDLLPSGRRVRVEVDGVTVADSTNGTFLFETNLPTRYYLPKTDVRMDLLAPSDTATHCPYKGSARYWSVTIDGVTHQDIVWGYDAPLPESQRIGGLVSFYNEKVDIYVDEVREERPTTMFS